MIIELAHNSRLQKPDIYEISNKLIILSIDQYRYQCWYQ